MASKSQSENLKKAQRAASTPEARAKAVATTKRRREEKEAKLATLQHESEIQIPLDAIPDREPKKKYEKKNSNDARVELAQAVVALVGKILGGEK